MARDTLPVAVLGAGWAGLVAASELTARGYPVIVFEASPAVGGMAQSFKDDDGFSFDVGAHFITNRLAGMLGLGAECRTVRHYGEAVWFDGRSHSYPYGLVKNPRFSASALRSRFAGLRPGTRSATSARDEFAKRYGTALTDQVAAPLVEAWSGTPAEELAPSVVNKISTSLLKTMYLRLAGRLSNRAVAIGYCRELPESASVWHVYPASGLGQLVARMAENVQESIRLSSPVEAVLVEDERAVAVRVGGEDIAVSGVFSSLPIHFLPKVVQGTSALDDLAEFRFRPMVFVNVKMDGRQLLPNVVLWTPEPAFRFFRLTEATTSMPWLAPDGKTVITADLGCEVGDEIWSMSNEEITEMVITQMEAVIPDARTRVLGSRVMRTKLAYPVFENSYEARRQAIATEFPIEGLVPIGRNGEFDHLLMEDVYWRTVRSVDVFARNE
ncbi:MAG: FAD-dependent oxidoreductase [Acidimicrobiia bacterium]|nr:FAD-dependent oxidoreductase [Acidimicrobiia bacterium]